MSNFIGIDLGTTNSAICSYDGSETRIWKSPEQNDVTPSVIYIDRRGIRYFGQDAYDNAPFYPDNCAKLFKRYMGTSTPIKLPAVDLTFTPEECSAEILKVLFGYLPEEIRNSDDTGTVITVPAAFNQMQRDATMQAAEMAGIGKVALMQEPVAAIMTVMRKRNTDGIFLIYDMGGGTLDIAIAESIDGKVNFLSQGGIQMCGGRDFDRLIADNVVRPWFREEFELPEGFYLNPEVLAWASEKGKIRLSAREEAEITLGEDLIKQQDLAGKEIYVHIGDLLRDTYDKLIAEMLNDSINCSRETMEEAGINPHDLECIVWVGGPTHYKPLRDKVAFELGVKGDDLIVNPMTAVAEGAAVFAESIDWSSLSKPRKDSRGEISSEELALTFRYTARTPSAKAKIAVQLEEQVAEGSEFQIDSLDTGGTSGRLPLKHGATVDVLLTKSGENRFKVIVYDAVGGPITIEQDEIVITKTAATVDAIPASHSIAIEVLDKVGGRPIPLYLLKKGDQLPQKGSVELKAGEMLEADSTHSLNFKLWEGEIEDPVFDNLPIGVVKIMGSDFDEGLISVGSDLICNYEIDDSGRITLEIEVPNISGVFGHGQNFYSRQEGQRDYTGDTEVERFVEEGKRVRDRIDHIKERVNDDRLEEARKKLGLAVSLSLEESDSETVAKAEQGIRTAKELLNKVTKDNRKAIWQIDLDNVTSFFDVYVRQHARPSEESAFDKLVETAQHCIDDGNRKFETHLDELRGRNFDVLWRQPWFIILKFKQMISNPYIFTDKSHYEELEQRGLQLLGSEDIQKFENLTPQERIDFTFIRSDVIEELRAIVGELMSIPRRITDGTEHDEMVNLVTNVLTG